MLDQRAEFFCQQCGPAPQPVVRPKADQHVRLDALDLAAAIGAESRAVRQPEPAAGVRRCDRLGVGGVTAAGTQGYEFYVSTDRRSCRPQETYVNGVAALAHLNGPLVRESVPKVLGMASLDRFEVRGDPGAVAAGMLAGFGASIVAPWHALRA